MKVTIVSFITHCNALYEDLKVTFLLSINFSDLGGSLLNRIIPTWAEGLFVDVDVQFMLFTPKPLIFSCVVEGEATIVSCIAIK